MVNPRAQAFYDVFCELQSAQLVNAPMHSLHEALGVIEEEFDEFRTEVFKNPRKHPERTALARREAIQLAAMAIRCIIDVCEVPCAIPPIMAGGLLGSGGFLDPSRF